MEPRSEKNKEAADVHVSEKSIVDRGNLNYKDLMMDSDCCLRMVRGQVWPEPSEQRRGKLLGMASKL